MRTMLKSKIHRARVTETNLNYEGSITIDKKLLQAADILPFEQVQVLNVNNGARFTTYAIEGEEGGGAVCLNGAAARLAVPGDIVIIITYDSVDEMKVRDYQPRIVHVNTRNEIIELVDQSASMAKKPFLPLFTSDAGNPLEGGSHADQHY
jgi:aspartate 1-decarboxylase